MASTKIHIPDFLKPLVVSLLQDVIQNRILHVPDSEVVEDARAAGVSVVQWRAVEAQQQAKVSIHIMGL